MWPWGSGITFPVRSIIGPFGLICGATYLLPYKALYPASPPGSSGSRSCSPVLAEEHIASPAAQWIPIPTKSANACPGLLATSCACTEPAPKTVGMSVAIFSRIVFAVATAPTLHPARVDATHGAGALCPSAVNMLNCVSVGVLVVGSKIGSVQYANETPRLLLPSGLK